MVRDYEGRSADEDPHVQQRSSGQRVNSVGFRDLDTQPIGTRTGRVPEGGKQPSKEESRPIENAHVSVQVKRPETIQGSRQAHVRFPQHVLTSVSSS